MKSGRLNTFAVWFALVAMAFLNWGPSWSARNGSGTMTIPNSFTPNTTISSADFNENFTDIANEITNSLALDGQSTMTGQLKAANGTVSAPSITFGSDLDSGAYRIGANNIGVAVNGAKVLDVATTGLSVTGTITPSGVIVGSAGTNSAPGYTFSGDLNTGIYAIGADNLGITAGGTKIVDVATTGVAVTGTLSTTGALSPASLSGTISGTPTFSGNLTFSGAPTFSGNVALGTGTYSGNATFSGALTFSNAAGITAKNTAKALGVATYSGGTPTLQSSDSLNIASVTDTATGRIRFTFTSAMTNANYVAIATAETSTGATRTAQVTEKATGYVIIDMTNENNTLGDAVSISVVVFSVQ